ncbi:MAG: hypothetical protein Q4B85_14375, partial [Lachnospiraceae bacterium]|nr:hypothetical protein [Lachnospiraceae bacterium]
KELQLLDNLIKARFVEMFGDLAYPCCAWEQCKLIEVCANSDDIMHITTPNGQDYAPKRPDSVLERPERTSKPYAAKGSLFE